MTKASADNGSDGNAALQAQDLLNAMHQAGEPLGWQGLVAQLKLRGPAEIKAARQVLNELLKAGQISGDAKAGYELVGQPAIRQGASDRKDARDRGEVRLQGGHLWVKNLPLNRAQQKEPGGLWVRAGDQIRYREQDGEALVTERLKMSALPVIGVLNLKGRVPLVEPLLRQVTGRIRIQGKASGAAQGDSVRVQLLDQDHRGWVGRITSVISSESVLQQAIASTLETLDIKADWPEAVSKSLPRLPKTVRRQDHGHRTDLSDVPLVTIDGATAKDFDDAVYAEPLAKGGWRLIVAIADVSHYVKPGSALDLEANERTTSVYLPDYVVPMLPEALSNELCSLKPEVDRLALVCDMRIQADGEVVAYEFCEGLIRSHARLTYEQVQDHLDHQAPLPGDPEAAQRIAASLRALHEVHDAFAAAKLERGGLDFEGREGDIEIEQGFVVGIRPVRRLMAHRLIEEAMINANVCAARFIEKYEQLSLYRIHEPPDVLKLADLRQDLMSLGVRLAEGVPSSLTYQRLLKEILSKPDGWLYQQMVLRSLKQAVYSPQNAGHFGLALPRYMHFTSPIRRYPDLLVHRTIKALLNQGGRRKGWILDKETLEGLGERCSQLERRAETAGWTVAAWLKCDLLRQHIGEVREGTVAGVTDFGLFIEVDDFFIQGLLHISDLGGDYFRHEPSRQCLVGERSGRRFALGDRLGVLIANVEPAQGKIELQLPEGSARAKPQTKKSGSERPKSEKGRRRSGASAKRRRR